MKSELFFNNILLDLLIVAIITYKNKINKFKTLKFIFHLKNKNVLLNSET